MFIAFCVACMITTAISRIALMCPIIAVLNYMNIHCHLAFPVFTLNFLSPNNTTVNKQYVLIQAQCCSCPLHSLLFIFSQTIQTKEHISNGTYKTKHTKFGGGEWGASSNLLSCNCHLRTQRLFFFHAFFFFKLHVTGDKSEVDNETWLCHTSCRSCDA